MYFTSMKFIYHSHRTIHSFCRLHAKRDIQTNNLTYDIFAVAIANAIPFVGFGFLDNFIMIIAVCISFTDSRCTLCRLLKLLGLSGRPNRDDVEHEVPNLDYGSSRIGQYGVRRHRNRIGALRRNVRPESRFQSA